eukprot:178829-Prorocentrum_minimum.AAC.2
MLATGGAGRHAAAGIFAALAGDPEREVHAAGIFPLGSLDWSPPADMFLRRTNRRQDARTKLVLACGAVPRLLALLAPEDQRGERRENIPALLAPEDQRSEGRGNIPAGDLHRPRTSTECHAAPPPPPPFRGEGGFMDGEGEFMDGEGEFTCRGADPPPLPAPNSEEEEEKEGEKEGGTLATGADGARGEE